MADITQAQSSVAAPIPAASAPSTPASAGAKVAPVFPSVEDLPNDFRAAYGALGTNRLVNTGACTLNGPQLVEGTNEPKVFNGKVKVWFTAQGEMRPEGTFIDYQTKRPITAPGAMEVFMTMQQLEGLQRELSEGYTAGRVIQARPGDVAAYDIVGTSIVNATCAQIGCKTDELPYSLLIERPGSDLSYEDARNRRRAAQLQESGRTQYLTESQQGIVGMMKSVGAASKAMAALLKS